MDSISFDPRLITENNLHDDIRPYRYQQNIQEQQEQQNQYTNTDNYDEHDNNNEEYMLENQTENRNKSLAINKIGNNASEYTTPESKTSAQNASQTETSATPQFIRIPNKIVNPRQTIHNPQSSPNLSPQRYITFELPPSPDDEIQDETQDITSIPNTSVKILSPTRTNADSTRELTRSIYDPPSVPSVYKHTTRTIQPENIRNNNQQTSNQQFDPFIYSFFPPSTTKIPTNNRHQIAPQNNTNINLMTQHPYEHLLQTNSSQSNLSSQNQRPSYSNIVQPSKRRSQNPPLSHIPTVPLYQMNQHTTFNPTTISPPVNMVQSVVLLSIYQYNKIHS